MSDLMTVARPYAKAAFNYAAENQAIDKWLEMLGFAAEVTKNADMREYLNASHSAVTVSDVFINICGDQLDEAGQNFVKVLAENSRLLLLPTIFAMFSDMKVEFEKEISVDLTSASTLTKQQIDNISEALERRFERKIQLNCNVDPSLIAGFVVKAGDTVIDSSINSKLNRLKDALQA
uniref:F0F1 ATP synthase subunit delta n=1 Tax=Ningiella ruwaisensis TaxID=2364274 RepID=UPI00109F935F|nr:F0F1 ATP synthase subunit delta [Ningiella ruwaisensis]